MSQLSLFDEQRPIIKPKPVIRPSETLQQKLERYRRESAQIRWEKRHEIEAIRQKREAADLKGKQRRVQASEACREGAG